MFKFTIVPVRVPVQHLYMTPGVMSQVDQEDALDGFARHVRGDWGEVDEHDWNENDTALQNDGRILSAYVDRHGTEFWIITEADRSAATILLPEEN